MASSSRNYTAPIRQVIKKLIRSLVLQVPQRDELWLNTLYATYSLRLVPQSISVDLGSGPRPKNPFQACHAKGLDIAAYDNVDYCDLALGNLPYSDNTIDAFTAYDVLEHIPRAWPQLSGVDGKQSITQFPFVKLMNSIHAALKPGGAFFAIYPAYPWPMAFQDPTHINIMTEDTMTLYFCGRPPWAGIYGFNGRFDMLEEAWIGAHHCVLLAKPRA